MRAQLFHLTPHVIIALELVAPAEVGSGPRALYLTHCFAKWNLDDTFPRVAVRYQLNPGACPCTRMHRKIVRRTVVPGFLR